MVAYRSCILASNCKGTRDRFSAIVVHNVLNNKAFAKLVYKRHWRNGYIMQIEG